MLPDAVPTISVLKKRNTDTLFCFQLSVGLRRNLSLGSKIEIILSQSIGDPQIINIPTWPEGKILIRKLLSYL